MEFETETKRPGFYVNGRWYSLAHAAQAHARARHLSKEFGRVVPVTRHEPSYA